MLTNKKKWLLVCALLLATVGIFVSFDLTKHHYTFIAGQETASSFCNISEKVNCDKVTASSYAEVFNFAISTFALGFYIFLFYLFCGFFTTLKQKERAQVFAALLVTLTLAATLYSVVLQFISIFVISAVCVLCVTLRLINIILLVIAWRFARSVDLSFIGSFAYVVRWLFYCITGSGQGFGKRQQLVIVGAIAALSMAPPLAWDSYLRKTSKTPQAAKLAKHIEQLHKSIPFQLETSGYPIYGDPEAPLTIVEFSDFSCPYCRRAASITKAVLHQYRGKTKLIFKHFPLDKSCNFRMQRNLHPFACQLAKGSICAGEQKRFWEFHDAVFALEKKANAQTVMGIAKKLKLDTKKFRQCLDAAATKRRLRRDIEEAYSIGVHGTPAFFFNGKRIGGFLPPPIFHALVDEALKLHAKKTK